MIFLTGHVLEHSIDYKIIMIRKFESKHSVKDIQKSMTRNIIIDFLYLFGSISVDVSKIVIEYLSDHDIESNYTFTQVLF